MPFPSPATLCYGKALMIGPTAALMIYDSRLVFQNPLIKYIFGTLGLKLLSGDQQHSGLVGGLVMAFAAFNATGAYLDNRDNYIVASACNFVFSASTLVARSLGNIHDVGLFFGIVDGIFGTLLAVSLALNKPKKSTKKD
ncbi:hypothetical protein HDU97_003716 [Phlyctochytrium planicorne]|nr:hypothetical protein HDU97_003716 [Phlyctochytrium planicorne]